MQLSFPSVRHVAAQRDQGGSRFGADFIDVDTSGRIALVSATRRDRSSFQCSTELRLGRGTQRLQKIRLPLLVGGARELRVQFRERAKSPPRSRARGRQSLGQRTNARADSGHGQSPPRNPCRHSRSQELAYGNAGTPRSSQTYNNTARIRVRANFANYFASSIRISVISPSSAAARV
jgi:hypothetical protein